MLPHVFLGEEREDPQKKRDYKGKSFSSVQVAVAPVTEGKRVEVASRAHRSLKAHRAQQWQY